MHGSGELLSGSAECFGQIQIFVCRSVVYTVTSRFCKLVGIIQIMSIHQKFILDIHYDFVKTSCILKFCGLLTELNNCI